MGTPSRATQTRGGTHSKTWPATPPHTHMLCTAGGPALCSHVVCTPHRPRGPQDLAYPSAGEGEGSSGRRGASRQSRGDWAQLSTWGPHLTSPTVCWPGQARSHRPRHVCHLVQILLRRPPSEGSPVCVEQSPLVPQRKLGQGRLEPHRRQAEGAAAATEADEAGPALCVPSPHTDAGLCSPCSPRTIPRASAPLAWSSPPAHTTTASLSSLRATQNSAR